MESTTEITALIEDIADTLKDADHGAMDAEERVEVYGKAERARGVLLAYQAAHEQAAAHDDVTDDATDGCGRRGGQSAARTCQGRRPAARRRNRRWRPTLKGSATLWRSTPMASGITWRTSTTGRTATCECSISRRRDLSGVASEPVEYAPYIQHRL